MSFGKPVLKSTSATFDRPSDTTQYSANDLVANSTTAGSVSPLSFTIGTGEGRGIKIVGGKLQKSATTTTSSSMILHLYTSSPTVANGDNGAFSTDTAGYLGKITFPTMTAFTDDALATMDAGAVSGGFNAINAYLGSTSVIYGLLQAVATYTPASAETFTATLYIEQS